jgi:tripartite ATP-independent transporter DctP family solute receptor
LRCPDLLRIIAGLLAAASLTLASPTRAQQDALALRLAHGGSKTHAFEVGAEEFARQVALKTNGKVRVQIFPEGLLSGEGAAAEAVRLKNVDVAVVSVGAMSNLVPLLQLLEMPYIFEDWGHAYRVLDGEIGRMLDGEMEKAGFVNLSFWEIGLRHLTNNVRPVREPADLHGLTIRSTPSDVCLSMLRAWGAKPVPISFDQLPYALEHGRVAGEENSAPTIRAMRFYDTQRYMTLTAHSYSFAVVVMNKERFEALPPETQAALRKAAKEAAYRERAYVRRTEADSLAFLRGRGVVITEPDLKRFREASEIVYRDMADDVPSFWVNRVRSLK